MASSSGTPCIAIRYCSGSGNAEEGEGERDGWVEVWRCGVMEVWRYEGMEVWRYGWMDALQV